MNVPRPKNLNLFTIKFPLPAIISILHRITGVVLFLFIPVLLWGLSVSLRNDGFDHLVSWSHEPCFKIIVWLMLMPFCFHFIAGIRHLLMDIHFGVRLNIGRMTAFFTLLISIAIIILAGIWLW